MQRVGSHGPKLVAISQDWRDGLVIFPHCNFIMQGAATERAFTADTIRGR